MADKVRRLCCVHGLGHKRNVGRATLTLRPRRRRKPFGLKQLRCRIGDTAIVLKNDLWAPSKYFVGLRSFRDKDLSFNSVSGAFGLDTAVDACLHFGSTIRHNTVHVSHMVITWLVNNLRTSCA